MARGRMIYRELFTSADLSDQPAWVRLLFAGLVVYSDDEGCIRDNPRFFSGTLLSGLDVRPCRVRSAIVTLSSRGCISCEKRGDVSWLRITNFFRFQRLNETNVKGKERELKTNETKAELAAPPVVRDSACRSPDRSEEEHGAYMAMLQEWGCQATDAEKVNQMLASTGGGSAEDIAAWRKFHALAKTVKSVRDANSFTRLKAMRFPHPDASGVEFWKAAQREFEAKRQKAAIRRAPVEERPKLERKAEELEPIGDVLEEFKLRKRKLVEDKERKEG